MLHHSAAASIVPATWAVELAAMDEMAVDAAAAAAAAVAVAAVAGAQAELEAELVGEDPRI